MSWVGELGGWLDATGWVAGWVFEWGGVAGESMIGWVAASG